MRKEDLERRKFFSPDFRFIGQCNLELQVMELLDNKLQNSFFPIKESSKLFCNWKKICMCCKHDSYNDVMEKSGSLNNWLKASAWMETKGYKLPSKKEWKLSLLQFRSSPWFTEIEYLLLITSPFCSHNVCDVTLETYC